MQLRITCIEKVVFEWEIKRISLPTEIGELKVLPWNTPMVTALKPWIVKFQTWDKEESISIGKWMVFVDWKIVRIATASATTKWDIDKSKLIKEKEKLEKELKKLRINGSIEQIEKVLSQLEKLNSDYALL